MAEWNNTVPLGQAGTGYSVVLGDSQAAQGFERNLGNIREQQQRARIAAQKQAEELAKSYRDNALKARDGTLFADQLSRIEGDYVNRGLEFARNGQDIYDPTNPNYGDYAAQRREIEGLREYAKVQEAQYANVLKNANELDPEDIKSVNDWLKGDIRQYYSSGAQLPTVNPRFNLDKALTGVRAATSFNNGQVVGGNYVDETTIDLPKTKQAVISSILAFPGGDRYLERVTGGIPPNELERIPSKKEDIKKQVLADYDGDPELREALAQSSVVKGSQGFDKWLDSESDRLYNAKRGYSDLIDRGISMASSGVRTGRDVAPIITPYQRELLARRDAEEQDKLISLGEPKRKMFEGTATQDGKTQSGGEVKKKSRIISDKFVTYDLGNVNLPQLDAAYNVKTGNTERTRALQDAKVTGLGYFKYRDGSQKLMMSLVKDNMELLIPEESIPQDVKNKKAFQAVYSKLGSPSISETTQQPATQNRTAPQGGYSNTRSIRDSKGNIIEAGVKNGKWYNTKTGKEIK